MLKKVLNAWGKYLTVSPSRATREMGQAMVLSGRIPMLIRLAVQTPESAEVLGDHDAGWFGKTGYSDLMAVANAPYKTDHKFEDVFVCDPSKKHYGFKSWDGT